MNTELNAGLSVAPEIARLAEPLMAVPADAATGAATDAAAAGTVGQLAAVLAVLAATPQRWWDLVRFDRSGPLRIPVPGTAASWLLVLPPGSAADCDCLLATTLAGEATETAARARSPRPLRPGRVRVHGSLASHRHHSAGPGYSVTLHAGIGPLRSGRGPSPAALSEFSAGGRNDTATLSAPSGPGSASAMGGVPLRED